jgi:hypothetical protein
MATKKQTLALLLLYLFKNSRHSNFGYLRMIFLLGRIKNYYTTLYKMIELMEMLIEPNIKNRLTHSSI